MYRKRNIIMKKIKRLFVFGLVIAIVVTSMLVVPANGETKIKLSKSSIRVNVGATYKLKVKGTKKKVKWSTKNKKIATVKKGTVKGIAKGSTTITAKVGKKKLKCKVTVNSVNPIVTQPPVNNELAANIEAKVDKLMSGEILYTIVNNNAEAVPNIKLSVLFNDETGASVNPDTVTIEDLAAGETAYQVYSYSAKCKQIDTTKSTISVEVAQKSSYKKYVTSDIRITGAKNVDNEIVLTYVNTTVQTVFVRGLVFYKDESGALLAVDKIVVNLSPGATEFETFSKPGYKYDMVGHDVLDDIEYATADWVYRAYYY